MVIAIYDKKVTPRIARSEGDQLIVHLSVHNTDEDLNELKAQLSQDEFSRLERLWFSAEVERDFKVGENCVFVSEKTS
jgi:hypothetical protein